MLTRNIVRPFTDPQIALVTTFADQAVIAIENVRLFDEVQTRTRELTEALEQQTATSEVLQVISSSPGELQPVFESMLENAVRICEAKFGVLHRYESGLFYPVAAQGIPPALAEYLRQCGAIAPLAGSSLDRLMRTKAVVHFADESTEPVPGCRPARRRALACRRADAQRGRTHRGIRYLPPGGSALPRQAGRAGHELCRAGRDRHREHQAAQRAARIAATADRDI
jgi:hypothetical protein